MEDIVNIKTGESSDVERLRQYSTSSILVHSKTLEALVKEIEVH